MLQILNNLHNEVRLRYSPYMAKLLRVLLVVTALPLTGCGGESNEEVDEDTTSVVTEDTNLDFDQPAEDGAEVVQE